MKKNSAFTLIELLAVIVILGLITAITIPTIFELKDNATKNALLTSTEGLVKSIDTSVLQKKVNGETLEASYTITNNKIVELNNFSYTGKIPTEGYIKINATGGVEIAVHDSNWCITKGPNDSTYSVSQYNGTCEYSNSTAAGCFSFDKVTGTITGYNRLTYTYDIDYDVCYNTFLNNGFSGDTVKTSAFCHGETVYIEEVGGNVSIDSLAASGMTEYLASQGVLTNLKSSTNGLTCSNDVIVPNYIDNVAVTKIGEDAFYNSSVTSISFPSNLKTIGNMAFYGSKLTSVTFANDGVTTIGDYGFEGNDLTSVTLPNSLTTIGAYAFESNKLTSLVLPDNITSIGDSAFLWNDITELTIPNKVTIIGNSSFATNKITTLKLGSALTEIGEQAFTGNNISNIEFSTALKTIKTKAFEDNNLTTLTIPTSVETIGETAFSNNDLTSITIPSSVKSLGGGAFSDNKVAEGSAYIYGRNSDGSINTSSLNSYAGNSSTPTIPSSVTNIENYAYYSNNEFTSLTIPSTVRTIGNYSFASILIRSLTINPGVTTIGNNAFRSSALTSLTIPSTVTSIGNGAFAYNYSIASLNLSAGLLSIGDEAFDTCGLTSLTIPSTVKTIGAKAFVNNNISTLTIPSSVTSIGTAAFRLNNMAEANAYIFNRNSDGSVNTTSLNSYAGTNTNVTVPNGVVTIGERAFDSMGIQNAIVPSSVVIPNSVKIIEDSAFGAGDLTSLTLPSGLTTIGEHAFYSNDITSIVIPATVTSIGKAAFIFDNFTSITFEANSQMAANSIGEHAFFVDDDSNPTITTIKYTGTTPQNWNFALGGGDETSASFVTGTATSRLGTSVTITN